MINRALPLALFTLAALLPLQAAEPWTAQELLQPAALAKRLTSGEKPLMIYIGPAYLYRAKHITGSLDAGPASKPEGIEGLMKLVKGKPPATEIILYCGCCPMNVCPNIRPAVKALKEAGFKTVRLLEIPNRLAEDWTAKGYPAESAR